MSNNTNHQCVFKKFHKYQLRGKGGSNRIVIPIEDRQVPYLIFDQYEEVPFSNTITSDTEQKEV